MNKSKINITESEWKVMQVLWNEPFLSLGEIKKELDKIILWDRTTINTLLRRLKNKGAVGAKDERYSKYYPLVSEGECLQKEMTTILNRFFYSSPKNLMTTLVKNESFKEDDIKELEKLLSEIKEQNK